MRFALVVDGTAATAERQAAALTAFLRDGLQATSGDEAETIVFYADDDDRSRLVALAPTRAVRLVKTVARRPDLMAAGLLALNATAESPLCPGPSAEIALFVTPAGAGATELVTRLACRAGGAVLTDALSIEVHDDRLHGRRLVYSGHLMGRFALLARPWCVSLDPSWNDSGRAPGGPVALAHDVLSDTGPTDTDAAHSTDAAGTAGSSSGATSACESVFSDLELLATPPTGDLADSRFLVVAGYGAGGREGTQRIARAAARMGAAFGASRPVVMNAWAALDRLVGVSGTRCAPALCVVAGASGAPALHAGIENAGFIVAINPDAHAPIASSADAVVLDDGVAVIEELAAIVEDYASTGATGSPED